MSNEFSETNLKHRHDSDVELARNGDSDAYGRLVDAHSEVIRRQMRHYSRDHDVCAELTHDVFVEAYFSLRSYKGDAPLAHWLAKIASRVGYRHWKKKQQKACEVSLAGWEPVVKSGVESIEAAEAAEMLFALLAKLDDKERMVLTLRYFEELKCHEVAERMGWSRVMTRVNTYRAKAKLRKIAEREGLLEEFL